MPDDEFAHRFPFLSAICAGGPELLAQIDERKKAQLLKALPGLKERAKTLVELKTSFAVSLCQAALALDDKARALLNDEGKGALKALHPLLAGSPEWTARRWKQLSSPCRGDGHQAWQVCPAPSGGINRNVNIHRVFSMFWKCWT